MSILFTPYKIGSLEIKNRFVKAPVYEGLAEADGSINEKILNHYQRLAKGGVGLICTGYMFSHPLGRAQKNQVGIHTDAMIPGLKKLADTVHEQGVPIAFEISHAGQQTEKHIIGQNPLGPSRKRRDPSFFVKPTKMSLALVEETIEAFIQAGRRAVEAGSDIIYLHAGGGDLLNQFLSPFFNVRKDKYGGSDENRFRILQKIITGIKKNVSSEIPILVKLNSRDLTPKPGIDLSITRTYARWLNNLGVNGLELTTGVKFYNHMLCWRGEVPVKEIVRSLPLWKKGVGWILMNNLQGKHPLEEGWALEDLKSIREASGAMALFCVGGMRRKEHMEEVIENGYADFISLARPLIREPSFVNKLKEGKVDESSCTSCNKCIGALMNHLPSGCYRNGLP